MTKQVERPKWILYRHTRDFSLLCEVATILRDYSQSGISSEEKSQLNLRLRDLGLYNERNPLLPLDAISHKINQLSYYMFGYQAKLEGHKKFIFSPLGNLLLQNVENSDLVSKIFLTMVWAVQFQHPHSGTDKQFQLFPFRLIFKLLMEPRLEGRLYAYEVAYYVVFVTQINEVSYEKLVNGILSLRSLSDVELANKFHEDTHTYVNSVYEWEYYVSELFHSAGILEKHIGEEVCKLRHGKTATNRKVTRGYVTIPDGIRSYLTELEVRYPYDSKPLRLDDPERLRIDVVKEIYSFYPRLLTQELEGSDSIAKLLELPKLIEQYANNPNNETSHLFEEVLEEGMNLFFNVEAHGMGGPGHTDIECLYLTKNKKFAVESKSTSNKLLGINVGRLREHREEIGGEYTIVVTPRYVPAAKRDIIGTPNVILLANTLAEYLYNCLIHDERKIDYMEFDDIIVQNLGSDVSKAISSLTLTKYALNR